MWRLSAGLLLACTQVPDVTPVPARLPTADAGQVGDSEAGPPVPACAETTAVGPCAGCAPRVLARASGAVRGVFAWGEGAVYASLAPDGLTGAVYQTGQPPVALTDPFEDPRVLAKVGPYVYVRGFRTAGPSSFLKRVDTRVPCSPDCAAPETVLEEAATSRFVAVVPRGEDELFLLRSTGTVWFMRRVAPGQWGALVIPSQGRAGCSLVGSVDVFLGCGFTVTRVAPAVAAPQALLATSDAPFDGLAASCGALFGHVGGSRQGAFFDLSRAASAPTAIVCTGEACAAPARAVGADAASLYWSTEQGLHRVPRAGGAATTLVSGDVGDFDLAPGAIVFGDGSFRVQRLGQ